MTFVTELARVRFDRAREKPARDRVAECFEFAHRHP
jgi:hypothetical protein